MPGIRRRACSSPRRPASAGCLRTAGRSHQEYRLEYVWITFYLMVNSIKGVDFSALPDSINTRNYSSNDSIGDGVAPAEVIWVARGAHPPEGSESQGENIPEKHSDINLTKVGSIF